MASFRMPFASVNISVSASFKARLMYVYPRVCGIPWIFRLTLAAWSWALVRLLNVNWTDAKVLYSTRATRVPVSEMSNLSTAFMRTFLNSWKSRLPMLPITRRKLDKALNNSKRWWGWRFKQWSRRWSWRNEYDDDDDDDNYNYDNDDDDDDDDKTH